MNLVLVYSAFIFYLAELFTLKELDKVIALLQYTKSPLAVVDTKSPTKEIMLSSERRKAVIIVARTPSSRIFLE